MDLCLKVMSLLFNMLPNFVLTFLPRSKCLGLVAEVTIHSDFGAQENILFTKNHTHQLTQQVPKTYVLYEAF